VEYHGGGEYIAHRLIRELKTQVGHGAHDPVIAPPGIFLRHPHHQPFNPAGLLLKQQQTPASAPQTSEYASVRLSEAEQYDAALKLLKVESALVRFPGEPLGLSRRTSHQVAKVVYTLNWFDAHLKKP
jgi:hypothetical protein